MPVYLLHGFRWPRAGNTGIRVHVIMHNLEECSVEYIQNAHSTADLLGSFHTLFPEIMKELEGPGKGLTFLEQYDPDDETSDDAVSQPFAFVGDKVVTIAGGPRAMAAAGLKRPDSATSKGPEKKGNAVAGKALAKVAAANGSALSVNVEEVVAEGPGFTSQAWEAMAELRDKLAEKEKIGWWVVYNGDPERAIEDEDEEEDYEEREEDGTDITLEKLQGMPANIPVNLRKGPIITRSTLDEKEVPRPPVPPKPRMAPKMAPTARGDPVASGDIPPTPIPIKDTTERSTSEGALSLAEKQVVEGAPKTKPVSKTEGFKKKFFGKRG